MDTLKETVRTEMEKYARRGLNSTSTLTHDDDNATFSVVTVPDQGHAFVSLLVRITPDAIIIERDQNDRPLVDALIQAGIPRSQIWLGYANEIAPQRL